MSESSRISSLIEANARRVLSRIESLTRPLSPDERRLQEAYRAYLERRKEAPPNGQASIEDRHPGPAPRQ
jgi:hypothetical protein